MFPVRIFSAFAIVICIGVSATDPARAETRPAAAASYIRTLFDTSTASGSGPGNICPDVADFGRFSAGRAWHGLSGTERDRFTAEFCTLAAEAVRRLRDTFPGLRLELQRTADAAPGLIAIESRVIRPGHEPWPVDWLVAAEEDRFRLADLRVLGISLGIFLRSLVTMLPPPDAEHPPTGARILAPWRRALDRAFPPMPETPR
jgi:hypothetical protein